MEERFPQVNFEAEQALLGAIFMRQQVLEQVQAFLKPEHFADDTHGRIYQACLDLHGLQRSVTPVTLKTYIGQEDEIKKRGGDAYLVALAGAAVSLVNAEDYGRLILELALTRDLIGIGEDIVNEAFDNPNAQEQIFQGIKRLEDLSRQCGMDGLRTVKDLMPEIMDIYKGVRKKGYSTGYASLDRHYLVVPGELSIVTGWTNCGKSHLIDHIMVNLASYNNWRFALCSLENPPQIHALKLASAYLRVPIRGPNRMTEEQLLRATDWVNEHFVFVESKRDLQTIDWALSRIETAHREKPINGFVLDPYNEFEHQIQKGQREDLYISAMLARVKRQAERMQAHAWFVAHPKTPQIPQQDAAPSLSMISGGGNWGNKADMGISVHRPWDDLAKKRGTITEVHVKKVRFNWEHDVGMATLDYDPQEVCYRDPERQARMAYAED